MRCTLCCAAWARGRITITRGRVAGPDLQGRIAGTVTWGTERVARFHAEAEGSTLTL